MTEVIPIKPFQNICRELSNEELFLLERLQSSVELLWRGGLAEPHAGVELYKGDELLGIWRSTALGFMYWGRTDRRPDLKAWSLEEAYERSLAMLVRHPRGRTLRPEAPHGR